MTRKKLPKNDFCMKNSCIECWWNWRQESISSAFYMFIFCTKFWCQKLQSQMSLELSCSICFHTKNACVKCWWNWHQKTFWHSPICKRIPPFLTLETAGFERELGPRPIKVGEESIKNVSSGKWKMETILKARLAKGCSASGSNMHYIKLTTF